MWPFNRKAKLEKERQEDLDYEAKQFMKAILIGSMMDEQAPTVSDIEDFEKLLATIEAL